MAAARRSVTILLIDDNSEDRSAHKRILSAAPDLDCTFLEASSGEEGLCLYRKHQPDCTLLDYLLPDRDGLEVLAALAQETEHTPVPVVMMTAHGDEKIAVNAMKAGALDYMVKSHETLPSMLHAVQRALREWSHIIERRRAEAALQLANEALERKVEERTASLTHANAQMAAEIVERERVESELRNAQEEVARYSEHLERLVEQRTSDLANAQDTLLRKERLAAIGQLTATVSHELRNPLGTIAASFHIVRHKVGDTDQSSSRAFERIDKNIARCTKIVDDMLNYTRQQKLVFDSVNVDLWLRSILDDEDIPEGVELEVDLRSDVDISIDRDRLRQAVLNVIENALQSMQESNDRSKRLRVSSQLEANQIALRITDTGPGIPDEHLGKVFEPLFSTKAFGVGLGLPLVKEIMQAHEGGVDVESAGQDGTTISLWLPLNRDAVHWPE